MSYEQELSTGSPEQKLDVIVRLVDQYQIPLREQIEAYYGLDVPRDADGNPDQLAQQQQQIVQQATAPLQEQIQQLQMQLGQQQNYQNGQAQAAHQDNTQGILQYINDFATAKDEAGEIAHPHFNAVFDDLKTLYYGEVNQYGELRSTLQQLYDRAIWTNDQVRPLLIQGQQEAADKQRQADNRKTNASARQAGASIEGHSGASTPHITGEDFDADLSRIWDELSAR